MPQTEKHDKGRFRKKLNSITKTSYVSPTPTINIRGANAKVRIVRIRVVFLRIGDIDTQNEKYQADVYFEARWTDTVDIHKLQLTYDQRTDLIDKSATIRMNDISSCLYWTPQLFIENAIGHLGEQDKWFTIRANPDESVKVLPPPFTYLELCEHRRIKGVFWEKLELNHFPADVQDLTISIATHHDISNCLLAPDVNIRSSINREAFFDQQEWKLYQHVATEARLTQEEYSFEDDNTGLVPTKHAVLAFTCRAARRPGYYYWNGFCLIFLITISAFCIFSIPPDLPQSRLQITCTLLLTSVTFRWIVNRSLPTISYLTTLDKYAIISIIVLVLLCIWHSIIATIIFLNSRTDEPVKSSGSKDTFINLDRYFFFGLMGLFIVFHMLLLIWLILVPYKRRREMEYLDRQYAAKKHIQFERINEKHSVKNSNGFSTIKSSVRLTRNSDHTIIIPNLSTIVPMKEEINAKDEKSLTSIEFNETENVFYDHTDDMKTKQKY